MERDVCCGQDTIKLKAENRYIPDLQKLRRFSLAIGLLLMAFSLAGVTLKPNEIVRPGGLPLEVLRPDLFPIVLMLASFYGMVRFYFYGIRLVGTPSNKRKQLTSELGERGLRAMSSTDESDPPIRLTEEDRESAELLYPVIGSPVDSDTRIETASGLLRRIEDANKISFFFYEIDFTAPVWFNFLAIMISVWISIT